MIQAAGTAAAVMAAKPRPAKLARQLAGVLTWAGQHHRLNLPFQQPLHRVAMFNPRRFPKSMAWQLQWAVGLAARPASHKPVVWGPPDDNTSWIAVVDASHADGRIGIILWNRHTDKGCIYSLPIPVMNQQDAELYSFKVALGKLAEVAPVGSQVSIISDSESSLFAMCKLSTKAVLVHRGRIMRQAAMILHETDFQVCHSLQLTCTWRKGRTTMHSSLPLHQKERGFHQLQPLPTKLKNKRSTKRNCKS